ncbi:hypothetical protein P280DRAFT_464886 [Massarina eburnea CBS 473.64]|uniref:Uncharacterized protein n=1 Tax=Massarina eburnea CBS 473.64 TaxID=1395130 RepID=A0A6A6SKG0_9PLEO|nr:hypothetical protein P280DRAFT_464886 [Massarina eburnea CBS 473.64]
MPPRRRAASCSYPPRSRTKAFYQHSSTYQSSSHRSPVRTLPDLYPALQPLALGEATLRSLERLDQLTDHITDLHAQISTIYVSARSSVLTSERETAIMQLKTLIEALEWHIEEHGEALQDIKREDIVGLYVVAGMTRVEALLETRDDFVKLENVVAGTRERVKEWLADIVYSGEGVGKEETSDVS